MKTLHWTSLSVALALLVPMTAHAFYVEVRGTDTAVPIRYADADDTTPATVDVTYRINTSSLPAVDGAADAVRAAFATWSGATCTSLSLNEGDPSDSTTRFHWMSDAGEIYILVYFTDSAEEWTGGPAAGHFFFAHDGTGVLVGGTVILNSRDHAWATDGSAGALDIQSVVTAILGRSLGITSSMEGNATFPRYAPGDTSKRELGSDDQDAIHFLYPSGDAACDGIPTPESECDGMMWPGEPACPPLPTTMPGDAGTAMPRDAGPIGSPDAGVAPTTDAGGGSGGDDGGCSVGVGRASATPAWIAIAVAALVARRRRRSR